MLLPHLHGHPRYIHAVNLCLLLLASLFFPNPFARLIPPNEFLSRPIQYFDPAIQACLRLLGSSGALLTLQLILVAEAPGVNFDLGSFGLSMALPDFIEGLQHEFATSTTVLWNCTGRRDIVVKQIDSIQEKGWEILVTMEDLVNMTLCPHSRQSLLHVWYCVGRNWIKNSNYSANRVIHNGPRRHPKFLDKIKSIFE